ncbi:MAG: RNA-guided pseudouridylation complex pseudouridine synthase subunit Cbf5 [Theionarchaea archaeon]|nr:RNA-guided pseudouridylation complex pseudouridine synthase subunit Cbf5 [Theionarchaea archaeon]MBU7036330.1 RNA-guided pseudouridylation complex pseudouridine synthase subunit Cbf5 [Theionarchaea archaeon]
MIFERTEAETSEKFGKKPEERSVEELLSFAVINLDKPRGPTSHEVVSWVKGILHVDKAGHSGTLDPKVTGVLPVAVKKATKALQVLLLGSKEYVGVMHLHGTVGEKEVLSVFKEFTTVIYQKPPVKSAVARRVRRRKIHKLELLEMDGKDVLFRVSTQAGTYIRKLCYDMGLVLGVGANMAELRRTRVSHFVEEESVYLQDVLDSYIFYQEERDETELRRCLKPVETVVRNIAKVWIQDSAVDSVCHGAELAVPGVVRLEPVEELGQTVAVMTLKDELVALGRSEMTTKDILERNKGIAVTTERVLMERGTYPRNW